MINIKKISFLLISIAILLFVSCEPKGRVHVSISTDVDTYSLSMSSVKGITLTPHLEGATDKDIQYHWSINSDYEMFSSLSGPQKEVINSGEPILFTPIAIIDYKEQNKLTSTITVDLKIEEKESGNVLAEEELIIENYSGTYRVKK